MERLPPAAILAMIGRLAFILLVFWMNRCTVGFFGTARRSRLAPCSFLQRALNGRALLDALASAVCKVAEGSHWRAGFYGRDGVYRVSLRQQQAVVVSSAYLSWSWPGRLNVSEKSCSFLSYVSIHGRNLITHDRDTSNLLVAGCGAGCRHGSVQHFEIHAGLPGHVGERSRRSAGGWDGLYCPAPRGKGRRTTGTDPLPDRCDCPGGVLS